MTMGRAPSSAGGRSSAAKPTARKSINEVPPPSNLAGFAGQVRIVREGRPATIYDQVE